MTGADHTPIRAAAASARRIASISTWASKGRSVVTRDHHQWFAHRREEMSFVEQLCVKSDQGFAPTAIRRFKKILFLSAIDSFSMIAADHGLISPQSNRDRFVKCVLDVGRWEHGSCVSVAVVASPRHPDHRRLDIPQTIKDRAADRLPALDTGCKCRLDVDWLPDDTPNGWSAPARLTHAHLLWDYRNSVLHEFHSDPSWCEYGGDDNTDAHYANVMGTADRCWRPCYTTAFLLRLARQCLDGLERAM